MSTAGGITTEVTFEGLYEALEALDIINRGFGNSIEEAITIVAQAVQLKAKSYAPIGLTKKLQDSIRILPPEPGVRVVIAGGTPEVPYARIVEYGASAHEIFPVSAEALHWEGRGDIADITEKGEDIFAKRVEHPGVLPQPFMHQAAEATRFEIPALATQSFIKLMVEARVGGNVVVE